MSEYNLVHGRRRILLSAWSDVRSKAVQFRDEDRVDVFLYDGSEIWAFVDGYNDTYETGIVTTLISKKVKEWDCTCFIPDSLVAMGDGSYKPIQDIEPGEEVITHTGSVKPVLNVQKRWYSGDIVGISVVGSNSYTWSTPNHEFFVRPEDSIHCHSCNPSYDKYYYKRLNECEHLSDDGMWIESGQLTENEWVLFPKQEVYEDSLVIDMTSFMEKWSDGTSKRSRGRDSVKPPNGFVTPYTWCSGSKRKFWRRGKSIKRFVEIDNDLAYVLGLYVGDGCTHNEEEVHFAFGSNEGNLATFVADTLEPLGFNVSIVDPRENKNYYEVIVYSKYIVRLFDYLCGRYSTEKQLNGNLLCIPLDTQFELAKGWEAADAGTTVNLPLALQMQQIYIKNGFKAYIRERSGDMQKTDYVPNGGRKIYKLESVWRSEKQSSRNRVVDNSGMWNRICDVRSEQYNGFVYNLEIEEDKSYTVDNIAVHNCPWGQWAFNRETFRGRFCSHALALYLIRRELDKDSTQPFFD